MWFTVKLDFPYFFMHFYAHGYLICHFYALYFHFRHFQRRRFKIRAA